MNLNDVLMFNHITIYISMRCTFLFNVFCWRVLRFAFSIFIPQNGCSFTTANFGLFNYVNKKLKKVLWGLLKLGKYAYLCRMNYKLTQYQTFVALVEQFLNVEKLGTNSGKSVVCRQLNNMAYSANIEDIVCLECRNV